MLLILMNHSRSQTQHEPINQADIHVPEFFQCIRQLKTHIRGVCDNQLPTTMQVNPDIH